MARYTQRLVIKMTPEDMQLLTVASEVVGIPTTSYARQIILKHINPFFKGEADAGKHVETIDARLLED